MCLHPKIERDLSHFVERYDSVELEEFDTCDYVYNITNAKQHDLIVLQLNVRGVLSKRPLLIELLRNVINDKKPDLVLLSETWLTPFSPTLEVPGYSFYHQCRSNKRGGGVGILASSSLRCKLRLDLTSCMSENECVTVELSLRNGNSCLVSSMYRPPNSDGKTFLACYNSILCQIKKCNPKAIIIGLDHNLDFLKSTVHTLTNEFIQSNLDFGLVPTITRPTRITHSSATLIDNIIVSQSLCGHFSSDIIINDMSDHLPTVCVIDSLLKSEKEPITITSRDTRPKNLSALEKQLSQVEWNSVLNSESCSDNMEKFLGILLKVMDQCIPICTHEIKHSKVRKEPWVTPGIQRSIEKSKRLYSKAMKGLIPKECYKAYNVMLCKIIRRTKNAFYQSKCIEYKTHTRKLWHLINDISGKVNNKSGIIDCLKINDVREYNAKKICDSFAKYFSTVGKKFAERIPRPNKSVDEYLDAMQRNVSSIYLKPTDCREIHTIVRKLA